MTIDIPKTVSLDAPIVPERLRGALYQTEQMAHRFVITAKKGGETVNMPGAAISGLVMLADGQTKELLPSAPTPQAGVTADGEAWVQFGAGCYTVPGRFGLTIYATEDGATTCIYACVGTISRTTDGSPTVPEGTIPTAAELAEMIAQVQAAIQTIPTAVIYGSAQTLTDAQKTQARTNIGAASTGDVDDVKSASDNAKSVFGIADILTITHSSSASAIDPLTGANGTVGSRSGYTSFNKPICIDYNESGFLYCVWVYTTNTASATAYSPTGKRYTSGRTIINPVDGTNPNFRVGLHRIDGTAISSEDSQVEFAKMAVYALTDTTLEKPGYPADAKETGDAIETLSEQITGLSDRIDDNKKQLVDYNAVNLFDFYKPSSGSNKGITLTYNNDGTITVDGTATESTFFNIINSSISVPEYLVPGRSYKLKYDGGVVPIRVYYYYTTGTSSSVNYSDDAVINIPADNLRGIIIRYQFTAGISFDNITTRVSLIAVQDGVGGSGETINNTYNITTSPQITTDTNGWLQSVDTDTSSETDKTDMTGAIMSMLTETGYCHLSPGVFYVSGNIDMPSGSMIEGCGESTVIRLLQSVSSGYILKPVALCQIKSLKLSGAYSAITSFDANIGTRHGINFEAGYGTSGDTTSHCMVDNIWIENFSGAGIRCNRTSINYARGIYVNQAYINRCHTGIYIERYSEFNKFANICMARCYNACVNNGGNNVFTSCTFHGSNAGFVMDDTDGTHGNNGHGSLVGCTFCHIGNNAGVAIDVRSIANGFVFADCQVWYNSINVVNSSGVVFNSIEFGRGTGSGGATINISGGGTILFSGCMFMDDVTYPPEITVTSNDNVKFVNCYGSESGNAISVS